MTALAKCNDARGASPNIFANHAADYAEHGLIVFPVGGDDGKRPLVANWQHFRPNTWESMSDRFNGANIGIVNGKGRNALCIIDIDDAALLPEAIETYGETPLISQTPSGGFHLWYEYNKEPRKIRFKGQEIDVLGKNGFMVAPPSMRPDGVPYRFIEGDVTDISHLPRMKSVIPAVKSLPDAHNTNSDEGQRNNKLFKFCLSIAHGASCEDELLHKGLMKNETYIPPLDVNEALRTIQSAWRCQSEGRNMHGRQGAIIHGEIFDALIGQDTAFYLMSFLIQKHQGLRNTFAIDQMKVGKLLGGKDAKTIRKARDILLDRNLIERKGLRGQAIQYGFKI